MERLGLWGEGSAFHNFESFLESITRRGLGAAEMLAMEMKSAGMYVSRGLSYKQAEVYLYTCYVHVYIHELVSVGHLKHHIINIHTCTLCIDLYHVS